MVFIAIGIILVIILSVNRFLDGRKFINEVEPYFKFLMESDYEFLLSVRYGDNVQLEKRFNERVRLALIVFAILIILFLSSLSFLTILVALVIAYLIFKMPYTQLKSYYNRHLYAIDAMLPYYLKSLEILIQHYTVPVALRKSITTAPDVFKPGLEKLCQKIEAGDSSVDPYMDFAHEYPVRDSMRMMRLLYRLGLGSQENKQEQLMMFSRTVSSLQNKAREQKYKNRLETMEKKTMVMLFSTGGGIIALLLFSLMNMMSI
ncbi:MAG: hypothetical protein NC181_00425 [Clostridium sp.]|nr:hypothetical protein [Clostridium sp.]MCM1443870.1 hypothetical protein [Candidatus Amulumruptor caecigallinarius]